MWACRQPDDQPRVGPTVALLSVWGDVQLTDLRVPAPIKTQKNNKPFNLFHFLHIKQMKQIFFLFFFLQPNYFQLYTPLYIMCKVNKNLVIHMLCHSSE